MTTSADTPRSGSDVDIRLHVYRTFVDTGRPPTVEEAAGALGLSREETAAAYRRLDADHALVLHPGTLQVWMANPLSAVPTPFSVETKLGSYWGNCIWDALGIPAMLGTDGVVLTRCPDCEEAISLEVVDGDLRPVKSIAHFAVPAASWWEDIGFT